MIDGSVRALQIYLAAAVPEKYGAKRIEQTVPGGVAPGHDILDEIARLAGIDADRLDG